MKTPRFNISIVTAMAVGTLVLILALAAIPALATFPGENGRIAFGRRDPNIGGFYIYTAKSDGSDVQQLTFVPSSFSDWRADGQRIAFEFTDSDGNEQIATVNPDGANQQQITFGPGFHGDPSWSPDGLHIVFDYSPLLPDDPNFTTDIYVMNSDGTNPQPVTTGFFDVEPRCSPDGTRIVFSRIRKVAGNGFQQEAIFIINADGSNPRQLTAWGLAEEHPTWSPDSQWIVFNVAKESGHPIGSSFSIYVMRPDGTDQHLLYNGRANMPAFKPQFSPDGTKILFGCYSRTNGSDDICVMNTDGSNVIDIISTPRNENLPSWGVAP
jgi:Tol biopolymer transport system component